MGRIIATKPLLQSRRVQTRYREPLDELRRNAAILGALSGTYEYVVALGPVLRLRNLCPTNPSWHAYSTRDLTDTEISQEVCPTCTQYIGLHRRRKKQSRLVIYKFLPAFLSSMPAVLRRLSLLQSTRIGQLRSSQDIFEFSSDQCSGIP